MRLLRAILRQCWGPAPSWGWMLSLGLAAGFIFGTAFGLAFVRINERYHLVEVLLLGSSAIPRPVTPPPPGMVWAKVLTTGYCPCAICCEGFAENRRTAINRDVNVHPFGIATDRLSRADPGMFTAGTMLDVPGYGHAMVDDVGGMMRKDAKKGIIHLDLRFVDHQQARRWGRKILWIAVPEGSGAARVAAQQDADGK